MITATSGVLIGLNAVFWGISIYLIKQYFSNARTMGESARHNMKEYLINKMSSMDSNLSSKIMSNKELVTNELGNVRSTVDTGFASVRVACKDKCESYLHALEEVKAEQRSIWDAVNQHGHKGLESNGAKVTR